MHWREEQSDESGTGKRHRDIRERDMPWLDAIRSVPGRVRRAQVDVGMIPQIAIADRLRPATGVG